MSNQPRIASAVAGQPAHFGTLLAHTPDVLATFGDLYAEFWQRGVVGVDLKEMTRLRNARVTDCGF
jgi:hypothetical protein